MLRAAGKVFGAAAGVAASGPPSQSQCRVQQSSRRTVALGKEESANAALLVSRPAEIGDEVDNGWLLTEWQETAENGQSILDPSEINDALNALLPPSVFGQEAPIEQLQAPSTSRVQIQELNTLDSEDGTESVDSDGADLHMQAAETKYQEVQSVSTVLLSGGLKSMVSNVLQDPSVQVALLQSLKTDPNYQDFLRSVGGPAPPPSTGLLPAAARPALNPQGNSGGGFFHELAHGIMNMAQAIGSAAAGASDAIGKMFQDLGDGIIRLLNAPHEGAQDEEEGGKERPRQERGWEKHFGKIFTSVAVAVFTLIVLKKVHLRFR